MAHGSIKGQHRFERFAEGMTDSEGHGNEEFITILKIQFTGSVVTEYAGGPGEKEPR